MRSIIIQCDICKEDIERFTGSLEYPRSMSLRIVKPFHQKEEIFREICLTCSGSISKLINQLKNRKQEDVETATSSSVS